MFESVLGDELRGRELLPRMDGAAFRYRGRGERNRSFAALRMTSEDAVPRPGEGGRQILRCAQDDKRGGRMTGKDWEINDAMPKVV